MSNDRALSSIPRISRISNERRNDAQNINGIIDVFLRFARE